MTTGKTNLNLARIVHRVIVNPRGWQVDELMDALDIKDRAYRKYRKRLQDNFLPFMGPDGESCLQEVEYNGVRHLKLIEMPSSHATEARFATRVAALHFAKLLLGFVDGTDVGDSFADLVDEFKDRLKDKPFTLHHLLRNVDRIFYQLPYAPKDYSDQGNVLKKLVHALIFTRKIRVSYSSVSFKNLTLTLEPYTLAVHRSALYLMAKNEDYEDVRIYAVDRIKSVQVLDERFSYPSTVKYDPGNYTEGSFGIYRSDSEDRIEFELLFDNERWLKLYVKERTWHPSQRIKELRDGRLQLNFKVNTDVEVWPWIRSFGDSVTVVKPADC